MLRSRLRSDASRLAAEFRLNAAELRPALVEAAGRIAPSMERWSQKVMQDRIYAIPIPRGRDGLPKWRRSRTLKRGEHWRATGVEVVGENPTEYAEARYRLGTSGGARIVSPGIQSVQWQRQVLMERRAWVLDQRRKAIQRMLRRRRRG